MCKLSPLCVLVAGLASLAGGAAAQCPDLWVTACNEIYSPFPEPAHYALEILPGEPATFDVRLGNDPGDPPPAAREWLRDNGTALVLPAEAELDPRATEWDPFEQRYWAACGVSVLALDYEPQPLGYHEGAVSFTLPAGHRLEPGAYEVVILLSPDGLEYLLAPCGVDTAGMVVEGLEFRVLDDSREENRTVVASHQAELAMRAGRIAEALSLAQVVLDRCPGSAVATAFHADLLSRCCPGSSAEFARALELLAVSTSPCDDQLLRSREGLDDVRGSWAGRASVKSR